MTVDHDPGDGATRYRCGIAARWLPRTLAASILISGLVAAGQAGATRTVVMLAAGGLALWIVRTGAEVRIAVSVGPGGLRFELGRRHATLGFAEVEQLRFEPTLSSARHWFPACAVLDRSGRTWRLSALLTDGGGLIDELVRAGGRTDLEAWADALRLRERMSRASLRVAVGYAAAVILLVSGLSYGLWAAW